jgi:hypothetical protein
MPDSEYNQLVTHLSRDIVTQMAPEELPLYPVISEAYVKDPEKTLRGQISKDEDLGFGVAEAAVLLTPVVLEVMKSVVMFLWAEVAKGVKQESTRLIGDSIKSMFKKYVPADTHQGQVPGLTSEQLAQVRLLALEKARQLSLTEDQALLLSDSIVGSLTISPPDAETL